VANDTKDIVYSQIIKANKGLNKYDYELSVNKETADKWKSKDKKIKIEVAKNGKQYLPTSKYKISVQKGEEKATTDFEITESKQINENEKENREER
jgi:hypothetical protein